MSNLIKQSFASAQQTVNIRPSKNHQVRRANVRKKYVSRRIKLKRLRERVYLSHFLSVNGIQPEHIICGEDDGKEPDFTLIINSQYIGVELTTLPRLRDRMGDKYLLRKRWYWKLRAKFTGMSIFFSKKLLTAFQMSWHAVFQHVNFYHSYDSHHDYFSHHQHHRHYSNQFSTSQTLQNKPTLKEKVSSTSFSVTHSLTQSPTLVTFPKAATPSQTFLFARQAFHYTKKYLKHAFNVFSVQTTRPNKPMSFISQTDIDAVMGKKAHKAEGYHRRRPLDALWLLVHTDSEQPDMEMALPSDASASIYHDSVYDEVWITVYPKRVSYKVKSAYQVVAANMAA